MGFFGNIGIGKTGMIENWLKEMGIANYTINSDYTIDVNGSVLLYNKNITDLPEYIQFGIINGDFDISYNLITTLRGCPKEVEGCFICSVCDNLTSLEGAPKYIKGDFSCGWCNSLTTLEGGPQKVGNDFFCAGCKNLKSLKGAPCKVFGDFYCNNDNTFTEDAFTEDEVKKYSAVSGNIYNK